MTKLENVDEKYEDERTQESEKTDNMEIRGT
jgi:hypothetical protein